VSGRGAGAGGLASRTNGHLAEIEVSASSALLHSDSKLASARAEVEADPTVWAVLIRAIGPDPLAAEPQGGPGAVVARQAPSAKPVILAATGTVSGPGFGLALGADVLVATSDARFLLPAPDATGAGQEALARCFDQLPYRVVTSLAMAHRPLTASRAHELGFVNELAAEGELEAIAREWAESILAVSPLAAEAIREAAAEGLGKDLATAIGARYRAVERYAGSADAAEALEALVEGRRPLWRGR
jgi:enoyl-CoA hydratase/carnithine racemase